MNDDEWFLSLPPERKAQIRRWLDKPEPVFIPDPMQHTIDEVLPR